MDRILIVDDDDAIRAVAYAALRGPSRETLCASSGKDGLALFSSAKPDLVVLDVELPDANGYDLCRAMRAQAPDVPVLFLTSHVDLASRLNGFEAGGQDYIPKPFAIDELRARVGAHLGLKRRQKELSGRNAGLELRERMRRDMEDMIVHDLKSPVAAIKATLAILRESGLVADDDYQRLLENSERTAGRLLLMINDLLDVSKGESEGLAPQAQEVDVSKTVDGAVELLRPTALRRGMRIVADCAGAPARIRGDQGLLFRIVVNLLSNALRFGPSGSEVLVSCARSGGAMRLCVCDRGPGIPAELKDKAFEKFVKLQEGSNTVQQGSGVGLAFCRLASEAMGGRIRVEDREDGGSRFVLELPIEGKDASPRPA